MHPYTIRYVQTLQVVACSIFILILIILHVIKITIILLIYGELLWSIIVALFCLLQI